MANRRVCSKNITIDGKKVGFATHTFWALSSEGTPIRVRHYRDLLRTGVFDGDRPASNIVSSYGPADGVHVLALAKTDTTPSVDEIALLLSWAERGPAGFARSFESSKEKVGLPGAVLGVTRDARRATNVKVTADRLVLAEGGWGHRRSPVNELMMLARSDRSSDAYYESAKERGARRRQLVEHLTAKDPSTLTALVTALRTKDNLRTPSLMIAVDAAVAGHPDAEQMLKAVLLRPDEPGQVLRYFFDTYRDGARAGIPSSIRRAVGEAATRLYTEDAALRFDRRRNIGVEDRSERGRPIRFADVLALTHPTPTSDEQSRLFGFLVGRNAPPSLLAERERLSNLSPEVVVAELEQESRRVASGGEPGLLSRLPWELLASVTSSGRTDVVAAEAALVSAKADRAQFLADPTNKGILDQERRLRTRLRDASRRGALSGAWETAGDELAAFRATPEFVRASSERKRLTERVEATRAELTATAKRPGKVHPAVWATTLPTLSDTQVLSLLGTFDRSGIDATTRTRVEERLSNARVAIPDILRTVRGAALAAAGGVQAENAIGGAPGVWTALPPSTWEGALDRLAAERVAERLPEIKGRVLILVDGSGSMSSEVSGRRNDHRAEGYHSLTCADVAGFAASAIASRCVDGADVYVYDTATMKVDDLADGVVSATRDVLRNIRGGGTDTHGAIASTWRDHDLLVVLTDEQTMYVPGHGLTPPGYSTDNDSRSFRLPDAAKVVTVNLAGYAGAHMEDSANRRSISGWSESLFDEIKELNEAPLAPEILGSPTIVTCPYCEEPVETGSRYPEIQARMLSTHKASCPKKRFLGGKLESDHVVSTEPADLSPVDADAAMKRLLE